MAQERDHPTEDPRPHKIAKPNILVEETEKPSTEKRVEPQTSNLSKLSDAAASHMPGLEPSSISLSTFVGLSSPKPLSQSLEALSAEELKAFHEIVVTRKAVSVILAAGQGSRFVSKEPKVVHPFAGKPLAQHALDAAAAADLPVIIIVGHAKEKVVDMLTFRKGKTVLVVQEKQMGTGHAVYLAKCALPNAYKGDVFVSYADNPGIDTALITEALGCHQKFKDKYGDNYGAMIVTGSRKSAGQGASAYGRIVRKERTSGPVIDIVEKKSIAKLLLDSKSRSYGDEKWSAEELDAIDEFNSGIVVAKVDQYYTAMGDVMPSRTKLKPPTYEYYATDFVKGLVASNIVTEGFQIPVPSRWKLEGANTVEELKELETKCLDRERQGNETLL